jgi:hypothetical protein
VASERNPETRRLVERALVRLLREVPERRQDLVVIGGLVPALLARGSNQTHQGTGDIDLLVEVGFVFDDDLDLRWLEESLSNAGFTPTPPGWRWTGREGVATVVVELLCERPGAGSEVIALPGAPRASAMNLPGTGAARCDATWQGLEDATGETHRVLVTGVGGYLLAKAAAASGRRLSKDYYDFAFVVLHAPGGPEAAAGAILAKPCDRHLRDYEPILRHVTRAFADADAVGAQAYAETAQLVMGDDPAIAAQDAVSALSIFASTLESSGLWTP